MPEVGVFIRSLDVFHYDQIKRIYLEGISTGNATFQTSMKPIDEWFNGVEGIGAFESDEMLGWATLASVSDRCVYRGVAELSIYVASHAQGRGIGKRLMDDIVQRSESLGIWTIQSGIFPENVPSIKVHLNSGFRVVGVREHIGQLNGSWRDVLLLERRSKVIF